MLSINAEPWHNQGSWSQILVVCDVTIANKVDALNRDSSIFIFHYLFHHIQAFVYLRFDLLQAHYSLKCDGQI